MEQRDWSFEPLCFTAQIQRREHPEEECDVRTTYQRDRGGILHSKAFRRMKDKTQCFWHHREIITVQADIHWRYHRSRTIAKALRLNEDLRKPSLTGHDLGIHLLTCRRESTDQVHPGGFAHYKQSVRVVEVLRRTETD